MRTNVSRAINDANRLVWQRRTTGDITHISYEGRRTTHQYKWFQLKSSAPILNQQSMREYSQWCVLAVLVVWVCPRHTSKKMRHHRWRHIDNLKRQLKESFARAHTIRLGIFLYSYCQFMALCMLCEIDRNLNFKIGPLWWCDYGMITPIIIIILSRHCTPRHCTMLFLLFLRLSQCVIVIQPSIFSRHFAIASQDTTTRTYFDIK